MNELEKNIECFEYSIFREDELELISSKKTCYQSSISKWSRYDDANRAIFDIDYPDYAFHTSPATCGGVDPWWIIDLKTIESIDLIKIYNRSNEEFKHRINNLTIERSFDGVDWTRVPTDICKVTKEKNMEVLLYGLCKARYIKVSLKGKLALALGKIKIYQRKKENIAFPFILPKLVLNNPILKINKSDFEKYKNIDYISYKNMGKYKLFESDTRNVFLEEDLDSLKYTIAFNKDESCYFLDLKKEFLIDLIKIFNKKSTDVDISNLRCEVSSNGKHWTTLGNDMIYLLKSRNVEILLSQKVKVRYIKLFINKDEATNIEHIGIYIRNIKGYIVAAKPDGFGMRIGAMINGHYYAKKTGFKFKFCWDETTDTDNLKVRDSIRNNNVNYIPIVMDKVDNVFDKIYLDKYLLKAHIVEYYNTVVDNPSSNTQNKPYGFAISQTAPYSKINNKELRKKIKIEVSQSYENIKFNKRFEYLKKLIVKISNELQNNFIAIHLRGGEIVFGDIRFAPIVWAGSRHFPYEVALDITMDEINKTNIVIFGQDLLANKELCEYINKNKSSPFKAIVSLSLTDELSNDMESVFFDINLMSKAKKIYSTGASQFGKVAELMSEDEILVSFYDIYSNEELFDILKRNIDVLNLHNLQKAFTMFRIYDLACKLDKPNSEKLEYLIKAYDYDNENKAYLMYIMYHYLLEDRVEEVERIIEDNFKTNFDIFLIPFVGAYGDFSWATKHYNNIFSKFIEKKSLNYPFLILLIFEISKKIGDKKLELEILEILEKINDVRVLKYLKSR